MEQIVGGYAPWSYRDAGPAVDRLLERGRVEDELGGLEVTRRACDEWSADTAIFRSWPAGQGREIRSAALRGVRPPGRQAPFGSPGREVRKS